MYNSASNYNTDRLPKRR